MPIVKVSWILAAQRATRRQCEPQPPGLLASCFSVQSHPGTQHPPSPTLFKAFCSPLSTQTQDLVLEAFTDTSVLVQRDELSRLPLEMFSIFESLLIFLGSFAKRSSVANVTSLPSGGPDAVQFGEKRGQGSVAREQGALGRATGGGGWGAISAGVLGPC